MYVNVNEISVNKIVIVKVESEWLLNTDMLQDKAGKQKAPWWGHTNRQRGFRNGVTFDKGTKATLFSERLLC